jgi:hypothetical protein
MNSVRFFGLPSAGCFSVRLRSFLRPGLCGLHCVARSGGQDWPQATAEAARSGLDGREHGASLDQAGHRLPRKLRPARSADPIGPAGYCPPIFPLLDW